MHLIALSGKKGSGKSTCGKYLVEQYGFKELSFAWPLKEIIRLCFGFTENQINGSEKEAVDSEWGFSYRWVATMLGETLFRQIFGAILVEKGVLESEQVNDFWILCLQKKFKALKEEGPPGVVITDLRYKNEWEWVKEQMGLVVRVERPGLISTSLHISEIDLDDPILWDRVIVNVNDDYKTFLDTLIEELDYGTEPNGTSSI